MPQLHRLGLDRNGVMTDRVVPSFDQGIEISVGPESMSPHEIGRRFFAHGRLEVF